MKKIKFIGFTISLLIFFFTGCSPTKALLGNKSPLVKIIKEYKYTPFIIPRTDWGAGTIITYNDDQELIKAFQDECLNISARETNSFLQNTSYSINKKNALEVNLAKIFGGNVNIVGALNNNRVQKVKISFNQAKEWAISEISIENKLEELTGNCLDAIEGDENLVLGRVLQVKSLEYSFYDENDNKISIDTNILDDINLNSSTHSKYEGKTSLSINEDVYIGYRRSKVNIESGIADVKIKIIYQD
ncbi:hypothetical protein [Olleya sp. YS]|uniref:hypothetical protein n=1 Tax=Olleya sp. YS TaxID=3028318 RepID=UPI00243459AE|nr:hypothetical protein [Olleya sp. YS]WGD34315.1 hypothetical protein Ollyesu_11060 [Olleya sp. YS]